MQKSSEALSAVQAAGAIIYNADMALKAVASAYAADMQQAVTRDPFNLANDALFDKWKLAARLSQSIASMEAELRNIYEGVLQLERDGIPSSVLALPAATKTEATDVVEKKPREIRGNTLKLMNALRNELTTTPKKVNRSEIGAAAGLPKGSVGASFSKLLEIGAILESIEGELSLP